MAVAPNRLLSARVVPLPDTPGALTAAALHLLACAILAGTAIRRARPIVAEAAAALGLVALVATAGLAAAGATASAVARASPAPGAWLAALALILAVTLSAGRAGASPARSLVAAAAGIAALAATGALSALSLAREAEGRAAAIGTALLEHLALSGAALALALAVAVPLSLRALSRPWVERTLLTAAGTVQVIPSLALFGLLIAPLAALATALPALRAVGIGGIGPAPAILGIAAYLVLPLARGTLTALRVPTPALLDAARGQGMPARAILTDLRIPLGAPVLRATLRVAAVQAIGLATLAALVGGGGLGTLVFQGIGQLAADLILLGILPILALSLAADALIGGPRDAT